MPARVHPVLNTNDLPLAELCAARLDGELLALDECFVPVDEVIGSFARAEALRGIAGDRAVAERASALWILGLLPRAPAIHTLCVDRVDRAKVTSVGRIRVRQCGIMPDDAITVGMLRVMGPVRCAFDLVRAPRFGAVERELLTTLTESFGVDTDSCRLRIAATPNLPGKRRALQRLDAVDAV